MRKTLIALLLLSSSYLEAQKKEKGLNYGSIITDRPDQTESPSLIPKDLFQIETGFSYQESSKPGFKEKNTTYNSTLLRYGLIKNMELRLGFEIEESKIMTGNMQWENITSGLGPLYTGFKIGISKESGLFPEMAFLGGVLLPFSATEASKPNGTGGGFRFAFGHTLSEKWSFSYNLGAVWNGNNPYISYIYSAVLGNEFTEKFSGFIEIYRKLPEKNESRHLIDAGFTYLLSNSLQLDISAGTDIATVQNFFVGAGISIRLLE